MNNQFVTLSTITPVYAGEPYLAELVGELKLLREKWQKDNSPVKLIESIFVDDGSSDNSSKIIKKLAEKEEWIRVVTLSRNFGQHSATVAGICHSMSDWIVSLDEDLQHQPKMIDSLLATAINLKLDVVYAKPISDVHGSSWRDKASKVVKHTVAKFTKVEQIKLFNSFRLVRGSVARAAASSASSQTYLDVALSWYTQSVGTLEMEMKDDRFNDEKKSGYGLLKLIGHFRRLMVSSEMNFSTLGLGLGLCAVLIAVFLGGNVLISKLFFPEAINQVGWASLAAIICAFSGVIVTLICIVLEYVNITLLNQLGRPTFFTIDRTLDGLLEEWASSHKG